MAAIRSSRDATACFQRCYKKLMVFAFKEDEETKASLNLLLDELIALDCNSFGISSEVNKIVYLLSRCNTCVGLVTGCVCCLLYTSDAADDC